MLYSMLDGWARKNDLRIESWPTPPFHAPLMASAREDDQTAPLDPCIREHHKLSQDPIDLRVSWSPSLSHIWNGLVRPRIYVDDLIVTGSDLFERFEMKRRVQVFSWNRGTEARFWHICFTTSVCQRHACEIRNDWMQTDWHAVGRQSETKARRGGDLERLNHVASTVGALTTRPDIAYAVSAVSQFMQEPRKPHFYAARQILRYVKGTVGLGILGRKDVDFRLNGYTDADWAGNSYSRRSTTGYCFSLGSGFVSWSSKKQPTVSQHRSITPSDLLVDSHFWMFFMILIYFNFYWSIS